MLPRPEHPRPRFRRDAWRNLNGVWEFRFDHGNSGVERGFFRPGTEFDRTITVPFCPQSRLSGIGYTDFLSRVWYRRRFSLSPEELSGRVLLHFGAVDYRTIVYVNGAECGRHTGGYTPFCFDVTDFAVPGENVLTVTAEDDERDPMIPTGKQSILYGSAGCHYTRTTGIWQTVWLEFVPETRVASVRVFPNAAEGSVALRAEVTGAGVLQADVTFEGRPVGCARRETQGEAVTLTIPLSEKHLWDLGAGRLYDVALTFGGDTVRTYFGLRTADYRGKKFFLNGRPVFQRLVLDQGFYPDGVYTAPSDAELAADVDRAMAMGFNGARLHQKVFEERFLYHCDRKGYLVWDEFPSVYLDHTRPEAAYSLLPEWLDVVARDADSPCVVGWCPFNETWDYEGRQQFDPLLALVYRATRAADPTRPCIDTSGNYHVETDVFDVHNYEQDPAVFAAAYADLADGKVWDVCGSRQRYDGKKPFFVSEYGGIRWTDDRNGWGYGAAPVSEQEFLDRLRGLTDALLDNPAVFAYCYTQLTDVEQEQNGLYTYDRRPKFPPEQIRAILARRAAVEG